MSLSTIILLVCIGLAAGFLSGLIGIGGGIIIVPALVALAGFSQKMAQGTSLGILLLPVGILAVIHYYKQGYLDVKFVAIISVAFVLGGLLGSKVALSLSDVKMKKVFAAVLLIISLKMLFWDRPRAKEPAAGPIGSTKIEQPGQ
jgi:uncharacterized membrane protein YfcA